MEVFRIEFFYRTTLCKRIVSVSLNMLSPAHNKSVVKPKKKKNSIREFSYKSYGVT